MGLHNAAVSSLLISPCSVAGFVLTQGIDRPIPTHNFRLSLDINERLLLGPRFGPWTIARRKQGAELGNPGCMYAGFAVRAVISHTPNVQLYLHAS